MGSISEMDAASRVAARLRCSVQNYDWGIRGAGSTVARLHAANSDKEIQDGKPYAEFWMGTHASGPSFVVAGGGDGAGEEAAAAVTLKAWVEENPGVLGEKVVERWGCDLPFLFKV